MEGACIRKWRQLKNRTVNDPEGGRLAKVVCAVCTDMLIGEKANRLS